MRVSVPEDAAVWHLRAGEEAVEVYAYSTALTHFDRAEVCMTEAAPAADFRYHLLTQRERHIGCAGRARASAA